MLPLAFLTAVVFTGCAAVASSSDSSPDSVSSDSSSFSSSSSSTEAFLKLSSQDNLAPNSCYHPGEVTIVIEGFHRYKEILKAEFGAPISFFATMKDLSNNDGLLDRIHERGKVIGLRTDKYFEQYLAMLKPKKLPAAINGASRLFERITGHHLKYVMLSWGAPSSVAEAFETQGLLIFQPGLSCANVNNVESFITKNASKASIIRFHSANNSVNDIREAIEVLQSQATFVRIDRCIYPDALDQENQAQDAPHLTKIESSSSSSTVDASSFYSAQRDLSKAIYLKKKTAVENKSKDSPTSSSSVLSLSCQIEATLPVASAAIDSLPKALQRSICDVRPTLRHRTFSRIPSSSSSDSSSSDSSSSSDNTSNNLSGNSSDSSSSSSSSSVADLPSRENFAPDACANQSNTSIVIEGLLHTQDYLKEFGNKTPITFFATTEDLTSHARSVDRIHSQKLNNVIGWRTSKYDEQSWARLKGKKLTAAVRQKVMEFKKVAGKPLTYVLLSWGAPENLYNAFRAENIDVLHYTLDVSRTKDIKKHIRKNLNKTSVLYFNSYQNSAEDVREAIKALKGKRTIVKLNEYLSGRGNLVAAAVQQEDRSSSDSSATESTFDSHSAADNESAESLEQARSRNQYEVTRSRSSAWPDNY